MDDRDRIITAFDHSGRTRDELAEALRVSVPSVGRLLRRERRLTAIERAAAFSLLGLEDGTPSALRRVPIIGMIAAGAWADAVHDPVGETWTLAGGPQTFALRIEGDSMDLIAPPGAVVVIDPDDREMREGRSYAIMREDGAATFKQFRHDPARLEPVSSNPNHRTIMVGSEPFAVIGRAIEVTRDL